MSNPAYVVTKDVRHLAPWTQDSAKHQPSYGSTGTYRPICGEKVKGANSSVLWPEFAYEDQLFQERSLAKPVCLNCLKILERLNDIAGAS